MRRIIMTAVVLSSVIVGGCGAEPSDESAELVGETSQEVIGGPPKCDTSKDWGLRYYSGPSKTTAVGWAECSCGTLSSGGQTTAYFDVWTAPFCWI
jgi:hypothetical protein